MLSLWSQELPFWNDCLQALDKAAYDQLTLLHAANKKYASFKIPTHDYNASAIWQQSGSTLYEYELPKAGRIILFVPSLINKASILDLSVDKSLLLGVAKEGVKTYLLDWGEPNVIESEFNIASYCKRLNDAIDFIVAKERRPVVLAGYCMGGLLAVSSALNSGAKISGLITIATPWNFDVLHFPRINYDTFLSTLQMDEGFISADAIKMMFYFPYWMQINQKMIDFAQGKFNSRDFIEIENWVNDGVKVAYNVMKECFVELLQSNQSFQKKWCIDGVLIDPANLAVPSLCVMATRDNIVPHQSANALANQSPNCKILEVDSGHIGMIINPKYQLDQAIANWCKALL